MADNENSWKGKPITYVDQNILDFLLKEPDFKIIFSEMQIVYSNETLAEIRRSGVNNDKNFLTLLSDIEAFYFYIEQKEQKTFITIKNCDPFQIYKNIHFGDVPPTYKNISANQLWHWLMLHSNIELGNYFWIFIQLNNTLRFFNYNPVVPEIDENQLSLHQAFAEIK